MFFRPMNCWAKDQRNKSNCQQPEIQMCKQCQYLTLFGSTSLNFGVVLCIMIALHCSSRYIFISPERTRQSQNNKSSGYHNKPKTAQDKHHNTPQSAGIFSSTISSLIHSFIPSSYVPQIYASSTTAIQSAPDNASGCPGFNVRINLRVHCITHQPASGMSWDWGQRVLVQLRLLNWIQHIEYGRWFGWVPDIDCGWLQILAPSCSSSKSAWMLYIMRQLEGGFRPGYTTYLQVRP